MPRQDRIPLSITVPGGIVVPIPRWTISLFGVIAVTAISFGAYRHFYPVEPELVSVKQANHLLRLEVQEYNRHIMEAPASMLEDPKVSMRVTAYEDGCIVIARRFAGSTMTRLLVDPSRADAQHKNGEDIAWSMIYRDVEAAEILSPAQPSRCLNPHPGPFVWQYGQRQYGEACWIPVVRTFQDGCVHYQMFNSCSGAWDTNQNGTPRVTWTQCNHKEPS